MQLLLFFQVRRTFLWCLMFSLSYSIVIKTWKTGNWVRINFNTKGSYENGMNGSNMSGTLDWCLYGCHWHANKKWTFLVRIRFLYCVEYWKASLACYVADWWRKENWWKHYLSPTDGCEMALQTSCYSCWLRKGRKLDQNLEINGKEIIAVTPTTAAGNTVFVFGTRHWLRPLP